MLLKLGGILVSKKLSLRLLSSCATTTQTMAGEISGEPLQAVLEKLENYAPKRLSEGWDNTGLLVEPYTSRNITKFLLTNDLTEDVALEAYEAGCEMIVSYHPPIFAPLKSVIKRSWKENIVSFLLEKRIALYSPHTSWDSVRGGVNDWLASAFPASSCVPLVPGESPDVGAGRLVKLESKVTLEEAVLRVKELTKLNHVRLAVARGKFMDSPVASVALCAGSGASVLKGVAADLYLTGEMLHHDVLDAAQKGTSVILTNHSDSERGFLHVFKTQFKTLLGNKVEVIVSTRDKDPLVTV